MTRVPAINGFLSLVCSGGRHAGCRPEEHARCNCTCHRRAAAMTNLPQVELGSRAEHVPVSAATPGSSSELLRRVNAHVPSGKSGQGSGSPHGGVTRLDVDSTS